MASQSFTIKLKGEMDATDVTKKLKSIRSNISQLSFPDNMGEKFEKQLAEIEKTFPKLFAYGEKSILNEEEAKDYLAILNKITSVYSSIAKEAPNAKPLFTDEEIQKINKLNGALSGAGKVIKNIYKEIEQQSGFSLFLEDEDEKIAEIAKQWQQVSKEQDIVLEKEKQISSINNDKQNYNFNSSISAQANSLLALDNKRVTNAQIAATLSKSLPEGMDVSTKEVGGFGISTLLKQIRELEPESKESAEAIAELERRLRSMTFNQELEANFTAKLADLDAEITKIEEMTEAWKRYHAAKQGRSGEFEALDEQRQIALNSKQEIESVAEQRAKENIEGIKQSVNELKPVADVTEEVAEKTEKAVEAQKTMAATSDIFKSLANSIENCVSGLYLFNKAIGIVKSAIDSVKQLDNAFTQIAIVSETTRQDAWSMFDEFNKMARNYSISIQDLTEGAKLFYQQGLNYADTMKMVEASTISAALGEVSMTEAANALTAAIQGYNETAEVAMEFTDKIAMVGAVSAADFNELSVAMQKVASSAYSAGIDFDHLLGYLGKVIETTREAPANVGTFLKTITARFMQLKDSPMKMLEDGTDANKVEGALRSAGIALRDLNGEFRPLQDVLDELGSKWDKLDKNTKAYIATVSAGSQQQSRFLALMNNYGHTMDLVAASQDSAGAAAQQYAVYEDSIQAATQRLSTAWTELYTKIINSDFLRYIIDKMGDLVTVFAKIPPSITAIGVAISAVFAKKTFMNIKENGLIGSLFSDITKLMDGDYLIGKFKGLGPNEQIMSKLKLAILGEGFEEKFASNLRESFKEALENGIDINKFDEIKQFYSGKGIELEFDTLQQVKDNYIDKSMKSMSALEKVGKTTTAIWSTLQGKIMIATAVIAIMVKLYDLLTVTFDETTEKIAKYNREIEKIENNSKTLDKSLETYDELSKRTKLNEEEQEKYNKALSNIKELYPDVITYTNKYGIEVVANSSYLSQQNEILDENIRKIKQKRDEELRNNGLNKFNILEDDTGSLSEYGFSSSTISSITILQDTLNELRDWDDNNEDIIYSEMNMDPYEYLNFIENASAKATNGQFTSEEFLDSMVLQYMDSKRKFDDPYTRKKATVNDDDFEESKQEFLALSSDSLLINTLLNLQKVFETENKRLEYNSKEVAANINYDDYIKPTESSNLEIKGQKRNIVNILKGIAPEIEELTSDNLDDFYRNLVLNVDDNYIDDMNNTFIELAEGTLDLSKAREFLYSDNLKLNTEYVEYILKDYEEAIDKAKEGVQSESLTDIAMDGLDNLSAINNLDDFLNDRDGLLKEYGVISREGRETLFNDSLYNDIFKDIFSAITDQDIDKIKEEILEKYENEGLDEAVYNLFLDLLDRQAEALIIDELDIKKEEFNKSQSIANANTKTALSNEEANSLSSKFGSSEKFNSLTLVNRDGEQYLSIAGKILLLEKDRTQLIDELKERYNSINDFIERQKTNQKDLVISVEDTADIVSKEQQIQENIVYSQNEELKVLNEQIAKLEQIGKLKDISLTMSSNVSQASQMQNSLQTIADFQEEVTKNNGKMSVSSMQSFLSIVDTLDLVDVKMEELIDYQGDYYTMSEEQMGLLSEKVVDNYNEWLDVERQRIQDQINIKTQELKILSKFNSDTTDEEYEELIKQLDGKEKQLEEQVDATSQAVTQEVEYQRKGAETATKIWEESAKTISLAFSEMFQNITSGQQISPEQISDTVSKGLQNMGNITIDLPANFEISTNLQDLLNSKDREKDVNAYKEKLQNDIAHLENIRDSLKNMTPTVTEEIASGLNDKIGKGASGAADAVKDLGEAIADIKGPLEALNKLLDELYDKMFEITADFTPFLDVFAKWEKEWEKFYNIRRLMEQIEKESGYLDNIISNTSSSGESVIKAYKAKIGNIIDEMSAANAYVLLLREEMSSLAVTLKSEYGDYFQVGANSQIYRNDANLQNINAAIDEQLKEIYTLKQEQNDLQNALSMKNGELDLHSEAFSEYESILNEIDGQIDHYNGQADKIANLDEVIGILNNEKVTLEANLSIEKESVRDLKRQIRDLEEQLDNIDIKLQLEENAQKEMEDYVSDMEDIVSKYESYYDELISTIQAQQISANDLLQIQSSFIDTAIAVQNEVYSAIVESYQKEIDEKKKQYDTLKQLDQDYLNSVKQKINEEKQARDDAKTEKAYQQNVQRAKLLQMDTSGAYSGELAKLQSTIESQRESLYDDLVDKQVAALEEEINKRAELFDQEVAALEERLAYYEENSIILWEMVNEIFSNGAYAIQSVLEGTANYMAESEVAKAAQRDAWEQSIAMALEGTTGEMIDILDLLIESANATIIQTYPEIEQTLHQYGEEFEQASEIVKENAEVIANANETIATKSAYFSTLMDNFMTQWQQSTAALTSYTETWEETVQMLKESMANNLQALDEATVGSIEIFAENVKLSAQQLYQDILDQKKKFAQQLESQIKEIQSKITAAIQSAANAITNAASRLSSISVPSSGGGGGGSGSSGGSSGSGSGSGGSSSTTSKEPRGYAYDIQYTTPLSRGTVSKSATFGTRTQAQQALDQFVNSITAQYGSVSYKKIYPIYKKGGMADFTGPAWLDGTPSAPERILSPKQTALFESMVQSLEKTTANSITTNGIGSSYNIGNITTSINVQKLDDQADINELVKKVEKEIVKTVRTRASLSLL